MSKRETLLEMVRGIREGIKTSPGLSHAPFSDEGWAIIEAALSTEGAPREPGELDVLPRLLQSEGVARFLDQKVVADDIHDAYIEIKRLRVNKQQDK
jgi:hypothetical protein